MAWQSTVKAHREGADIYRGDALRRQKSMDLLHELHLPKGLLPLQDVEEVICHHASGFVWLSQKKPHNHNFAFVEDRRVKRLTGVKSKELLIWVTLCEFFFDPEGPSKITFRTPAGLSRTFPASAFDLQSEA